MITVLKTEAVDPAAQFRSFQQAIRHIADLSAHRPATSAYNATIRKSRIGFLDCTFVNCDSVVIERGMANIGRDGGRDYFLAIQVSGRGATTQIGRSAQLEPGDFSIVDSALPYSVELDGPVRRLVVRFPREEVARRGLSTDRLCGHAFRGEAGASGLASRMLRALEADASGIGIASGHSIASAILDLIADSDADDKIGGTADLSPSQEQIIGRIRGIVLTNLSNPDLSVATVAEEAGISVRYLHKLFSATGTTMRKWIEDERLDRAYREIRRGSRKATIQQIAFANGFNDPGYFCHRFTLKFGIGPRNVRADSTVQLASQSARS